MSSRIQILPGDKIDRVKWDACVRGADNGLVYSHYAYLSHMCDRWYGAVIGDYDVVMALPWRKKFGISYIYQPAFIQQLGFIGDNGVAVEALDRVRSFTRYGNLLLNYGNTGVAARLATERKTNFVIDLATSYETITAKYSKDLTANLRKATRDNDLHISSEENIDLAISVYRDTYHHRVQTLVKDDYTRFRSLCEDLYRAQMCFTREVRDQADRLLAIGLFVKDEKRIYNMMNTTTEAGRDREANHFLLDAVIREFCGQKLLFDFEGSDLPGVKKFYQKFGPAEQPYFLYHYNKLPALIRLFKR
jgi:hypothetical protein